MKKAKKMIALLLNALYEYNNNEAIQNKTAACVRIKAYKNALKRHKVNITFDRDNWYYTGFGVESPYSEVNGYYYTYTEASLWI